jgi:uncharacterized damage-inducible protein DinB
MMEELLPGMRAVLATTPARWTTLIADVPDDLLRRAPAPGEWSAVDCLRHLRDVEQDVFHARVQAFRAGREIVPYDPDTDGRFAGEEAPVALAADFARLRAAGLALLDEVTRDELALTVAHPEYGPVRLCELLQYWAAHDLMHTVQAERALMQPFIGGSGPWRVMCADHDIAAGPG